MRGGEATSSTVALRGLTRSHDHETDWSRRYERNRCSYVASLVCGMSRHPAPTQNADQQSLPCTSDVLPVGGCGLDLAHSLDYPRFDHHPTTTRPTPIGRGLS